MTCFVAQKAEGLRQPVEVLLILLFGIFGHFVCWLCTCHFTTLPGKKTSNKFDPPKNQALIPFTKMTYWILVSNFNGFRVIGFAHGSFVYLQVDSSQVGLNDKPMLRFLTACLLGWWRMVGQRERLAISGSINMSICRGFKSQSNLSPMNYVNNCVGSITQSLTMEAVWPAFGWGRTMWSQAQS